ncbi:MAG TPA: Gx transporter family protein [Sedimentibacter sp.]|nr:Gx transporter family protein [Sedimentibacter sp.]HNZ82555.1 Gx transporter family protein [Sedimentibacter sp.]HOH70122.1 Gx transporter family protein [Sedimentibacter sp.]
MNKIQRYIFLSLLTAAALILSIIEGMIPLPYIAPGAKLGLSNIVILSVVVIFGPKDALLVVIIRSILLMLVATNPITFIYSVTSGIVSTLVMSLGCRYLNNYFSLIGISVLGAMAHNTTQVTVAAMLFTTFNLYYYLPILSLVSIFTGCFVGYTAIFVTDNLEKTLLKLGREA